MGEWVGECGEEVGERVVMGARVVGRVSRCRSGERGAIVQGY